VRILFALPLALTLVWALLGAAQTNPFTPLRVGQLTGMKVEDGDGQKVGTIRNLILDTRSGELKYVVIGSGGVLGVHATLKLAPAQSMSAATAKRDTLAVMVTHAHWNRAPVFKTSSIDSLAEPDRAREISSFFELSVTHASDTNQHALATTGTNTGRQANAPEELKFANELIGARVVNEKLEKIGEVRDLLVSFHRPQMAFVILSNGRLFHHGHQYAVPLSALTRSDENGKWMLNVEVAALEQAVPFSTETWQDAKSNSGNKLQIYSYNKSEEE
jgi:uncharacterized protein YrrD